MCAPRRVFPVLVAALLLAACGGTGEGGAGGAGDADGAPGRLTDLVSSDSSRDTHPDAPPDTPPDTPPGPPPDTLDDVPPEILEIVPELPPSACGPTCPPGFCDDEVAWCAFCGTDEDCPAPLEWCKENRCAQTPCLPGSQSCLDMETVKICKEDGSGWTASGCSEDMTCHAGECVAVVCEPEATQCDGHMIQECAPTGAGWISYFCPPGKACLEGGCVAVKNNLLVVFDTSGSMDDPVDCICPGSGCPEKPYPECEDADCPATRIGLAKLVFRNLLNSEELGKVNLVITHFPMDVDSSPQGCQGGYYSGKSEISGDNGAHTTLDGDWFDQGVHEILSVPFPQTMEETPLLQAANWFNNQESVAATEEVCSGDAQCPGGVCTSGLCWYHDDPELRADGGTPLGKSIFYAGELYRKMIYVQGRTCQTDGDCANPNYSCMDGACHDPYRQCRTNMILLLTDGMESSSISDFFNPRVQAKRFRYGLCCSSVEDCFDGAEECTADGDCGLYPHTNSLDGSEPNVTEGPCRLFDYSGEPIKIFTHVIDLSSGGDGQDTNKQIADEGGGQYHHASDADPDELLMQMLEVLDFKLDMLSCFPEF
ncbi:MAG: hypothetical protein ABIK09_18435 [Pseudomonadota bacterium]